MPASSWPDYAFVFLAGQSTSQRAALLPFPEPQSVEDARANVVHICRLALDCGARLEASLAGYTPPGPGVWDNGFPWRVEHLRLYMRCLIHICSVLLTSLDTDPYMVYSIFTQPLQQCQDVFVDLEPLEVELYKSRLLPKLDMFSEVQNIGKRFSAVIRLLRTAYRQLNPTTEYPKFYELQEYLTIHNPLVQVPADEPSAG